MRRDDEQPAYEKFHRKRRYGPHLKTVQRLQLHRCNGKKSYGTWEWAEKTRLTLLERKRAEFLKIYKCPYCFHFHLTSQRQWRRKR